MGDTVRGLRVALLERPHPAGHRGAIVTALVPLLEARGAHVQLVHAEQGRHRLDAPPPWDVVVLKSGSAAALHLAAATEAWGRPSVNATAATRLAQDRIAVALLLQGAGLPVASSWASWLDPARPVATLLDGRPLVVKAARGSQGRGVWPVGAGAFGSLRTALPAGPYLVMEHVAHSGDDLKVYVAGEWTRAIERPFPARTYEEKLGRAVPVPPGVHDVVTRVGELVGLTCFGCDFVRGPDGWVLVDVNAFPGYKGVAGAGEAITAAITAAIAAATGSVG